MLESYIDFVRGSDQYKWLEKDLKSIDRKTKPWVMVLYIKARVDLVFARSLACLL